VKDGIREDEMTETTSDLALDAAAPEGGIAGAAGAGVTGDSAAGGPVFDSGSGISEAEQREIFEGIERAVRRDRRSLGEDSRFTAKKRGLVFPILVNAAALLLLGAGLAVFLGAQAEGDPQVRRATALYNSAERALIQEIRRETAQELRAKEREIDSILAKLTGVDEELRELYSSNQELTAEQRAVEANLQSLQEEYRTNLGSLQDERSRILESSRAREASLRAQFDERAGELAAQAEQSREALSSARSELERLSGDQEKGAAIEAQLSGMYVRAAADINGGRLGEAAATLNSMRGFINTPSFQGIRSVQPRRAFYLSSIGTLEGLIKLAERLNAALDAAGGPAPAGPGDAEYEKTISDLEERNAALEEQVADLNQAVSASDAEGSGLDRQIGELRSLISGLQTRAAEQERILEERQRGNDDLTRRLNEMSVRAEEMNRQVDSLTGRNGELSRQTADLTGRNTELTGQIAELTRTLTERDGEIGTLREQNAEQAGQITSLTRQLAGIRELLQGGQTEPGGQEEQPPQEP
jgi:predicted RNase H-like nuclease (RuvC/YqgF family)